MTDSQLKRLAKFIRGWRQAQSITQAELATALGVKPLTVIRWEQGVAEPDVRARQGWLNLLGKQLHEAAGISSNWKVA
jgi:transcriptional regulator with XRE-family HTH domain